MVIINLSPGTHTIKWTLYNYYDLTATIKISSSGQVSCINVTNGSCGGSGTPRVIVYGTNVTGHLKAITSPTTPPPTDNVYKTIQAEDYIGISTPMTKKYDPSPEGNYYVYNPSGFTTRGHVKYNVDIPKAGRYKIVGLVLADTHGHNSFGIKIDSQPNDIWDISPKPNWQWVNISKRGSGSDVSPQYPIYYNDFGVGKHSIYIHSREEQTKLRKLIVTNDLNYVPGTTIPTPSPTPSPTPPTGKYTSFNDWSSKHGGQTGLKGNLSAYLELGPAYLKINNIGFTVTLSNLLDAGRFYLGL